MQDRELKADKTNSVIFSCDLTSDAMEDFISYCEQRCEEWKIVEEIDELIASVDKIKVTRTVQLAAKQAGDATVTSVFVLALALPTLGAVVLAKKKRRI